MASSTSGVVLDPFGGTGTTALVATMLGRQGISVDASADYCRLAQWRCGDDAQRLRVLKQKPAPKSKPRALSPDDLFGGLM
jgi:DNA modification methylase